jgi:hypothetical protein
VEWIQDLMSESLIFHPGRVDQGKTDVDFMADPAAGRGAREIWSGAFFGWNSGLKVFGL